MRKVLLIPAVALVMAIFTPGSTGFFAEAYAAPARAPLLMEGKKTLYQRVLTRPGAVLKRTAGEGPGAQQPALTRFYVYGRKVEAGKEWLEVGLTAKGNTDGWLDAGYTLPWKQQLTLAFTNPAGRDRALLFKDRDPLQKIVESDKPADALAPLRRDVEGGKGDPRIVSIEPETYVDIAKKFYLLPILDAEETFTGLGNQMRLLHVASVSADSADKGKKADPSPAKADSNVGKLQNFRASLVFVIDSTISMGPYIDRTRQAVARVTEKLEKAGLGEKVKFGLVAFRSSTKATPALEYVSKLYVDPNKVKDGKDFLDKVKGLQAAKVSSARFSEDAYAGVMTGLNDIAWNDFGGRYIVLITDAGALKGGDELSSTHLDAEQVRLEAQHRGVAVYTLHLRTKEGTQNHAEAEAQYKSLTSHPQLANPLYYPVEAGSVEAFGAMVDALADAIAEQVNAASRGEATIGSARAAAEANKATTSKESTPAASPAAEKIRRDAAMLGQAMQLAYLGRVEGTEAPPLFSAWLTDRDLAHPEVATTEVRVLLTKNQLSDMQQVLKSIAEVGAAAQLSPKEFFSRMQSAAAVLGRDPNAINSPNATKLADLGLMGEYLDGLPYRSKVLSLDQATWTSWSIPQQQAFLDEVNRKLRLYQIYHDDVDRWVALDNGADPGEAVYPVPLDALP